MIKFAFIFLLAMSSVCFAQKINNKISFEKGITLEVTTDVISASTMEIMGQSMESKVSSTVIHNFYVVAVAKNSAVLDHNVKTIKFKAEGMGQSQEFNSDKEADRNNEIGKSLSNSLNAKYSITVDPAGIITGVKADTTKANTVTDPMMGMLLAQLNLNTEAPKTGDRTIFNILPAYDVSKGTSWTDSSSGPSGKRQTTYTVNNITDKEVLIDFTETSTLNTTQQIMGFDATINTISNGSGQITIERGSGILRQKKATIKSQQTIEAQGQKVPSTSSLTITTVVK